MNAIKLLDELMNPCLKIPKNVTYLSIMYKFADSPWFSLLLNQLQLAWQMDKLICAYDHDIQHNIDKLFNVMLRTGIKIPFVQASRLSVTTLLSSLSVLKWKISLQSLFETHIYLILCHDENGFRCLVVLLRENLYLTTKSWFRYTWKINTVRYTR